MTPAQAVRLVAMLGAYWNREMGEDTAGLWAKSLVEFEIEDGMEAVHLLGENSRFVPSLAELVAMIEECRKDRLSPDVALPDWDAKYPQPGISFGEWLKTMATDEEKASVARTAPTLAAKFGMKITDLDEVEA